ncbi:uncharacterized protein LOC125604373 [Brassica napus]|uniref:uncharacterized protein LOC125604373 n=1 Tax=Brassica napus TaxID=3708 RepID=UPI002078FAAB|nr:uncharacterized protein LOC125604373 [Brassica napus]
MTTRYTAAEKGKALASNPPSLGPPRLRMRAPDFDPTDLIKENSLTLVGRLTNTREQRMSAVLPYLARKWNLDVSSGSDLGNGCFQFRFNREEDLRDTLHNRPYQYGRWMIIIQRWEPVISQTFPSQIPFWISLRGIPLHYWHEKVVRNIGLELGELETYEVTKTLARVRVIVDGLKPLIMEAAMDYDSGEESIISLEYENLGNHCTHCYRLSHLQSQCPERTTTAPLRTEDFVSEQLKDQRSSTPPQPKARETREPVERHNKLFQQRLDRHGRAFGNRISSTTLHPPGPRNKLAPSSFYQNNPRTTQRQKDNNPYNYSSPPYTRRRHNNQEDRHGDGSSGETKRRSPVLQWKAKSPLLEQEVTPPSAPFQPPRQSVGRNLEAVDFPPSHEQPTREEVMEEIREATLQYINCPDPMESAARKQRVLQSEMNGDVEEAATRILQASTSSGMARSETLLIADASIAVAQVDTAADNSARPVRKRGRPPKPSERRTTVRVSPKTYSGMGSKKRNLARLQGSPGVTSRAGTARAGTRRTTQQAVSAASATTPPIVLIPASSGKKTDFPRLTPDLP